MNNEMITNSAAAGFIGGSTAIIFFVLAIVSILQIIAYWKIFTKAGKPGWHSIVPFLNIYDEYDIAWDGKYGLLLLCLAFLTSFLTRVTNNLSGTTAVIVGLLCLVILVASILLVGAKQAFKLSKAFGKGTGFAIGLFFFEPIFMLILGFGDSKYLGKDSEKESEETIENDR